MVDPSCGGHVGKAVVYLAKWLGFKVAVSDDARNFVILSPRRGRMTIIPLRWPN